MYSHTLITRCVVVGWPVLQTSSTEFAYNTMARQRNYVYDLATTTIIYHKGRKSGSDMYLIIIMYTIYILNVWNMVYVHASLLATPR